MIAVLARIALMLIGGFMLISSLGLPLLLFFGFIGLLLILADSD